MNKKGKIAWEYIAAIILGLAVLVIIMMFSGFMKDKALHAMEILLEALFR